VKPRPLPEQGAPKQQMNWLKTCKRQTMLLPKVTRPQNLDLRVVKSQPFGCLNQPPTYPTRDAGGFV